MIVAVYCSAKNQIPEAYKTLGRELGAWIAQNGHTLLYGGATGGLMTEVSDATREHGGEVIGVVPHRIIRAGRKAENCTEQIEVENMSERKQKMREMSDCFICLPGSYGTLDEMMDVIASGTVGEHRKPVFVVNFDGFYDALIALVNHMQTLEFIPKEQSYKPCFVNTLDELFTQIQAL